MKNPHHINSADVPRIRKWIRERGGIAIWRSVNLSNPGASWTTPATIRKGDCEGQTGDEIIPYPKPTWQAGDQPERIITDEADVLVCFDVEVKRFRVGLRRGGNGLSVKVTDGGTKRIRAAVAKAGIGAYHGFDYGTQEAIIFSPERMTQLSELPE